MYEAVASSAMAATRNGGARKRKERPLAIMMPPATKHGPMW